MHLFRNISDVNNLRYRPCVRSNTVRYHFWSAKAPNDNPNSSTKTHQISPELQRIMLGPISNR